MNASVNSIETFGLVDGPGIRTVIFLNGCKLRCKFCHNPETWLKKENIHIAIDTAGIGNGDYKELLENIDMVLLDIKAITKESYLDITRKDELDEFFNFINQLNKTNVDVWIRQVIIPEVNDNKEYMENLAKFLHKNIKNIKRIDFLPFHTLGFTKYEELKIVNPYKNKPAMDKEKSDELYKYFISKYKENKS